MLYNEEFLKADAERDASRRRAAIHFYRSQEAATACGVRAWVCKNSDSEADTTQGERINVTSHTGMATCRECVKRLTDAECRRVPA